MDHFYESKAKRKFPKNRAAARAVWCNCKGTPLVGRARSFHYPPNFHRNRNRKYNNTALFAVSVLLHVPCPVHPGLPRFLLFSIGIRVSGILRHRPKPYHWGFLHALFRNLTFAGLISVSTHCNATAACPTCGDDMLVGLELWRRKTDGLSV